MHQFSGSWDEFFELYMSGNIYFGSWFDHVLGWWKHKDADNMLFLKYEDLKRNLREGVQKIADSFQPMLLQQVLSMRWPNSARLMS